VCKKKKVNQAHRKGKTIDWLIGYKHSPETIARLRIINKEISNRPEVKLKMSLANKGKRLTSNFKGVAMGMPWGIPSIVAATATGFAAVRNIAKTKIPGQSGTSVSAPSASSVIAPLVPQAVTTNLNQSSINAVGNVAQGGVNRNYITDSDYTNANERNLRLTRASRLG